jgi:hypothetical protein
MQRSYFFVSVFIVAALLTACAPKAAVQPDQVRALQKSSSKDLPEKATATVRTTTESVPHNPPASCPITTLQNPSFTAPAPYSSDAPWSNQFWYGTQFLWTALPIDGIWSSLPHNPEGYTQKVFWWREGYVWTEEPEPDLLVTGERLDASVPPLIASKATNAYASDIGSAMLVGVDFPALGCWKITGKYKDAELSFVVWVVP